jgi:hypothetical protein
VNGERVRNPYYSYSAVPRMPNCTCSGVSLMPAIAGASKRAAAGAIRSPSDFFCSNWHTRDSLRVPRILPIRACQKPILALAICTPGAL